MSVIKIPLTKGQFALIDAEDYPRVSQFKWHASKSREKYYAKSYIKQKPIKMHRLVLNITNSNILCDHKDGNTLNNTKINLRKASTSENSRNRLLDRDNSTGYKGVSKLENKFMSRIGIKGINTIYIGCFDTAIEAALAYDEMAIKLHGEFAKTNKMLGLL